MSNRINDRNNSDAAAVDRMIQDRNKAVTQKGTKSEFQSKLVSQKMATDKEKEFESVYHQETKKTGESDREKTSSKTAAGKTQKKPDVKEPQTKSTPLTKTTKKTEKKEADPKANKTEKKREDVVLENAVKEKGKKDTEDDNFGGQAADDFFQQSVNLAAQANPQVSQAQNVAAPPKIPQEIINQMVDRVFVGLNAKGLQQFVIELKGSIFGGSQISVSAQGKKISLKFSGLSDSAKGMLQNSKAELAQRFSDKNLSLNEFTII